MYTKNPFIDDNVEDLPNQDSENDDNWPDLTENELQNAINLFNPKKACGPDAINFTIVQKSFQSLKNVFFMIYSKFIRIGYHPLCWRTGLGVVLKKPNKSDYSLPKSYRIITLLNCLGKIAEKIVANRLAYFGENSNLLDIEQMGGRKNHSAIDAVMNVVHDIEIANRNKSVLSCLLLDVKGAFDFVSINQLLNVMKKLKLSRIIIQWVKHFMTKRSINLIFDENKSKTYYVESGIPQGSPISPILFLIYIRHLFPKIRMKFNAHSPSFIDDVAIYVENKTAKQNCKEIEIIVKTAFDWAASNNVKFDDDKSELIHFEKTRNVSKDTLELPNGTVLEPKNVVKWLGVWLDRKLNFKKHVETRISSANRSFFAIQNLMKSEWGLKPTACRQLYLSCIIPISDYGSEIWYNGQKKYEKLFQNLQNRMIRKILGTFKTTPIQAMEIESHVLPVKLRLLMKNQKYAIRLLKIAENNPICQRIPNTYSIKFENIGFDTSLWNNKYAEWNEDEKQTNKRHPSQLIRVLHSVSDIVHKTDEFEQSNHFIKPWKSPCKIEFQIENTKESAKSSYYSTLSKIQSMNSDKSRVLLYTDGSKIEFATSAVTFAPIMRNWSSIINNFDRFIEKDCLIKYHTISKSWKLSKQSSIKNAELHAILQAMKWVYKLSNTNILSNLEKTIWIFSDSINAINEIHNSTNHIFARQIRKLAKRLFESNYQVILQWVPSHSNITENEIADKIAKTGHNQILVESSAITFDYVKDQINQNMLTTWTNQWQQCKSKGKYYEKFEMKPGISRFYYLSNNCSKLIFATIMQLKFGHGYFRSYLHRLKDYNS